MYAVIRAGGKQHKVSKGDVLEVELIRGDNQTVEFTPLLIVDDKGKVRSKASELAQATVTAKVVEETKGPKIKVFKYKNKTGYRRTTGHRQRYSKIEISQIRLTRGSTSKKDKEDATDGS